LRSMQARGISLGREFVSLVIVFRALLLLNWEATGRVSGGLSNCVGAGLNNLLTLVVGKEGS
jgi:hypothetical protein